MEHCIYMNKSCHTEHLSLFKSFGRSYKNKMKQVDNKNQIFIKYNFKITLKSDRSV